MLQRKLRAVIDTNLFVSGLFARDSLSAQLQDLWVNQDFELVTSIEIIKEVSRVLSYPRIKEHFKPSEDNIRRFFRLVFRKAIISKDIYQADKIADDPTDNKFLACALEKNSSLLQLSLKRNNRIDQAGATSLKLALLKNCTLRELDLSTNDAIPAHCTHMVDFLCGKANAHRAFMMSETSDPLWPFLLARLRMDPDLLYSTANVRETSSPFRHTNSCQATSPVEQKHKIQL